MTAVDQFENALMDFECAINDGDEARYGAARTRLERLYRALLPKRLKRDNPSNESAGASDGEWIEPDSIGCR